VNTLLCLPEYSDLPAEEIDLAGADFRFRDIEEFWCDARPAVTDWMIYVSHEQSITLAGDWLVRESQRAWPDWASHLWSADARCYRAPAT
jgi:hypothetical protein